MAATITTMQPSTTCTGTPDKPPSQGLNTTDVVYQDIRLYIEGVQVPFEAISISQVAGRLPTASFQVPPQSGLMDICKYYAPKVHVFYMDAAYGGLRLLFWGNIVGTSFSHSRSGSGSASIRFNATHKNHLLSQVTLDYSGYLTGQAPGSAVGENGVLTPNALNSQSSILSALRGITGVQTNVNDRIVLDNASVASADETKLMASHDQLASRYVGMPAVGMNFWNQLKKSSYLNGKSNTAMVGMFIPLVEDGIGYFRRTSGHTSFESLVERDRQQYCLSSGTNANVLVPPSLRVGLVNAYQAQLAVELASSALQFSGELTDFSSVLDTFYYSVGYELMTLASPSEVPVDPSVHSIDFEQSGEELMAVETIVKPQLHFYYAPTCNVILPRMFHTIQVNQDEQGTYTRVTSTHDSMQPAGGSQGTNYRGPHSIREAIAYAASTIGDSTGSPNLLSTLGLTYNAVGKYEQGYGIRHMKISLPWWLQTLTKDQAVQPDGTNSTGLPARGTPQYLDMLKLAAAWQARHGYDVVQNGGEIKITRNSDRDALNPYSQSSKVMPYQSTIFTGVDYEFTKGIAGGRTGVVECIFNPYIIPGYPMDVMDDTPNHPSFHGVCSSVTHNITSRSISTSVGMMAVQTYAELSNYYTPPAPPWIQTALNLISVSGEGGSEYGSTEGMVVKNAGSLLNNVEGKLSADDYYASTLGVGAADPTFLLDWSTGQVMPQARLSGVLVPSVKTPVPTSNGGDANDYNTSVGNLRLVSRPIESLDSIAFKFDYDFIDLTPENYNNSVVPISNPALESSEYLEPGASPFLEYMDSADFSKAVLGVTLTPNTGATSDYVSRRYGVK